MKYKLDDMIFVNPVDPVVHELLLYNLCKVKRLDEVNDRVTVEFEGLRYNLSVGEVVVRPVLNAN